MASLERAIALAAKAHTGQRDKAGAPYILHPLRVMLRLDTPEAMQAAVLHDVLEDTPVTVESLRDAGFSEPVIEAVDALTRRPDETYTAFIDRVKAHPIARRIKLADLEDNLDLRRLPDPDHPSRADTDRVKRYYRAWTALTDQPGHYLVVVDDHRRRGTGSGRRVHDAHADCESAVAACRGVIDGCLRRISDGATSAGELWERYLQWGETPSILGEGPDGDCGFSARDYARQRVTEMVP